LPTPVLCGRVAAACSRLGRRLFATTVVVGRGDVAPTVADRRRDVLTRCGSGDIVVVVAVEAEGGRSRGPRRRAGTPSTPGDPRLDAARLPEWLTELRRPSAPAPALSRLAS